MNTLFLYTKIIGLDICTQTLKKKNGVTVSKRHSAIASRCRSSYDIKLSGTAYHVNVRAIFSRWQVDNSDLKNTNICIL